MPVSLVCFGGIVVALCWLVMVLHGKAWPHRWNEELRLFEQTLGEQAIYPLFTRIRSSAPALNPWLNITAVAMAAPGRSTSIRRCTRRPRGCRCAATGERRSLGGKLNRALFPYSKPR